MHFIRVNVHSCLCVGVVCTSSLSSFTSPLLTTRGNVCHAHSSLFGTMGLVAHSAVVCLVE